MESLVGLAYAAADGGRDLWRRSGTWVEIHKCPNRSRQEVWGELQELWTAFVADYQVPSPNPMGNLWPHNQDLAYHLIPQRSTPEIRVADEDSWALTECVRLGEMD